MKENDISTDRAIYPTTPMTRDFNLHLNVFCLSDNTIKDMQLIILKVIIILSISD